MKKGILLAIVIIAQLIAGKTAHAQTTTIFDYGSQWKYLDNGSNQGTAWRDGSFSDASWSTGTGFFGYGDSWINTCVNACGTVSCSPSCGTKYITTYFRKVINIQDTAVFDSLRFGITRDDGMVVYVNGVEVWRDNMPTGTITYTSTAPSAMGGSDEYTPIVKSIPISAFMNGNNVIAVELHQQSGTSSDLTFNMQALGIIRPKLFSFGAPWKYLDNGSNQGTAWRASKFNDASWATGSGYMGYGESWINTCLNACGTVSCNPSCGTKYITTYFRKNISILDVALFDSVRLSMYRDDGAVVYINGTEVWRDHMPTGTIAYNTLASSPAIGGSDETTAIVKSIPISAFVNGNNVIAVEIHQQAANSSDLDFNMEAIAVAGVPAVPVVLTQGPYLQMGNQTAVTLRWRTGAASKSRLMAGTTFGAYPIVANDAAIVTEHEVRITGLQPNTRYFYAFGTDTSVLQADTSNFFVTAPTDTSTRRVTIAAFGDCGRNDNSFQTGSLSSYQSYLSSQNMKAADIMMLVGDNAYNSGTDAEYSSSFFSRYSGNILKNHMLFPAPGNHDYASSSARQADHNMPYYDLFTMPSAGECGGVPSGTEAYYSYDWGNVHILSLDSYGKENAGSTRLYDTLGAQVSWIKADLAANTKKWVIAYWHHPPYTMGSHNSDGESELVNIRQNFIKILERNGVDLIICGHSHDYERSYLLKGHYGTEASFNKAAHTADSSSAKYDNSTNSCPYTTESGRVNHGTVYVVSGSAGADGGVQSGYPHNALPFSIDDGGMFFIDIQDNRLDARFIRRNNTIGDKFTIMKDVKVEDTLTLLYGESVNLTATWPGAYSWAPGVTDRTISVSPTADTIVTVTDNPTNTCLTDRHFIDMQCTTPDISVVPADIINDGCHATVTYAIADTGRPSPAISYAFSGATIATGMGSGSGSLFSVGVTTVTLTASNECGSTSRDFTVTIQSLPSIYNVTGGGNYCAGATGVSIGLDNSQTNVTYQLYDGASMTGTVVAGTGAAIAFGVFGAESTYTVLATDDITGCTQIMSGDATVAINALPVVYNVTGGGNYCPGGSGAEVTLDNSETGVNYTLYEGASAVGAASGTGGAISFGAFTTVATYTAMATNATTACTSEMNDSAIVGLHALPVVHTVTGGGAFCSGGTGVAIGLDMTESGDQYQLFNGTTPMTGQIAGTGLAFSFGNMADGGTYTAIATGILTGCTSNMTATATVVVNPLPVAYSISGGGNYCLGGAGSVVGLASSEADVTYQLYHGVIADGSPVAGTGSSISFGLHTIADDYSVSALKTATGCVNTMVGPVSVGINPLPVLFSVTGGGNFCSGGTGVAVGLGGSNSGISYQLYNGTAMSGVAMSGTGVPLSFGAQTAAGTYSVVATNVSTGCINSMPGAASVAVTPLVTPGVTLSATPSVNVCSGTSVTYMASPVNGGTTPAFEWFVNGLPVGTGGTAYSFVPANGNVVSVKLNSTITCVTSATATAATTQVVLPNVTPHAGITAVPGNILCAGTPATITVSPVYGGTSPSYTWLKNSVVVGSAATYAFTPADGDVVLLSMTSNQPCRTSSTVYSNSIVMEVNENYVPAVSLVATPGINIIPGQKVTFKANVTGGGPAPKYTWVINKEIVADSTATTFTSSTLANNDSVSCLVTGSGICGLKGFNSLRMKVQASGIAGVGRENGAIIVVPNPTTGVFSIEGTTGSIVDGPLNIAVTNVLGQVVYKGTSVSHKGVISERVSLATELADGVYVLTVTTANGNSVFNIVLKR